MFKLIHVVPVISNPTKKQIHLGLDGGDREVWATKMHKIATDIND